MAGRRHIGQPYGSQYGDRCTEPESASSEGASIELGQTLTSVTAVDLQLKCSQRHHVVI